jgi:hypothetical protein
MQSEMQDLVKKRYSSSSSNNSKKKSSNKKSHSQPTQKRDVAEKAFGERPIPTSRKRRTCSLSSTDSIKIQKKKKKAKTTKTKATQPGQPKPKKVQIIEYPEELAEAGKIKIILPIISIYKN